ncbi:MAG: transcriptional regulator, LuxR family [Frankiales bacterium]|nr:transcriptional regulator, LuxR family [Frankiales bacterium]
MIRSLVSAARVGQSGCLLLTGEAGIGKTALLDDAVAVAVGMRVLRATGTESDSEVPFGVLLQLLRPALAFLDRIPSPQAAALGAALALRPGPGGDRFAVGAATLSLLSRLAEDRPLAVLIDDCHLVDVPSAQALTFAARRFTADPIAVLAAARDGRPTPFREAGLPELPLAGLSLEAAGRLAAETGHRLSGSSLHRLHTATGGNPLAVVELADDVGELEIGPFDAPFPVPASLARAFGRRVDTLSDPARTVVLLAAAGGGDLDLVARACLHLGVDVAALGAAEEAGLVRISQGAVEFRHPLVRSAVYADASPGARRGAHRALAAALPPADGDRRAWHLAEAALGPDEPTAQALEDVAARARRRSAHAVAAGAYERAALLTPDLLDRAGRLVSAAESAWQAGMAEHALTLLARASDQQPPLALRLRIAGLHGTVSARTGSVLQARDVQLAAGLEAAASDPDEAVLLLAEATLACFALGDTATVRAAAASIDAVLPRVGTDRARLVGELAVGVAGVLTGEGGPERIRRAVERVDPASSLVEDARVAPWLVLGPLFLRESRTGRALVATVVDSVRRRSAVGGLPFLLFHLARDEATTDRWDVAELTYSEGIHLAREAGHAADLTANLAGLAWLEARQGQEDRCREHAEEALALCSSHRIALFRCWSLFALGELELGLGRPAAAIGPLERLERALTELGLVDVDLSPAPELVDALVRVGRHPQARALAEGYAARAQAKGQPWALARAARASALTCPDDEIVRHVEEALGHHERNLDTFELARTQLAYGSRLRRVRHRVAARPPLRAALAAFEALGAAPWADQAAAELLATGETAQRRGLSALAGLTPQELQVAQLLAAGRTTREAAAALFLSPKTVEYHLRHVYVKLGIQSRADLTRRLDGR